MFNFEVTDKVQNLKTEKCFHIEINNSDRPTETAEHILQWILKQPQAECGLAKKSQLVNDEKCNFLIEIGPRFNFSTAQSTNSVSICQNVGLKDVCRVEVSVKYLIAISGGLNKTEMVIK